MNAVNKANDASYEFVAPNIPEDAGKKVPAVFPTAETIVKDPEDASAVAVRRQTTIVKLGNLRKDMNLLLEPDAGNLNPGAVVAVNWKSNGTAYTVAVISGEQTVSLPGTAFSKAIVTRLLVWDGEGFLAINSEKTT